jgi:hypothetical protein
MHPKTFSIKNTSERKKREYKTRNLMVSVYPTLSQAQTRLNGKRELDFSIMLTEMAIY